MKKNQIIWISFGLIFLILISIIVLQTFQNNTPTNDNNQESAIIDEAKLTVKTLIEDLDHPWDVKSASNGDIYFTQRQSGLYKYDGTTHEIYIPEDLYKAGEGGMLGFDLAPDFEESKEIYACFNSNKGGEDINVVVAKLTLSDDLMSVEQRSDIVDDIESANSGRHSGCRVLFDRNDENIIWITTGDAANGENPQDPKSLNGKVLRIDREGNGISGNLEDPFDERIFSYGHRNIQGITLLAEYSETYGYGFTAEHGPDVDDEINPLLKGNFGWDPNLPYDESVPMTDLDKYPDAIEAVWSSGNRTIAMSGIEYIEGGEFEGDILLTALKDNYILRFTMSDSGKLDKLEEVINDYGRIRQVYQSMDGRILFTTDNGGNDIIGELIFK